MNTHVKLNVALVIPILGKLNTGAVKGNLLQGVHNKFQVKTFASGEVALTLVDDKCRSLVGLDFAWRVVQGQHNPLLVLGLQHDRI